MLFGAASHLEHQAVAYDLGFVLPLFVDALGLACKRGQGVQSLQSPFGRPLGGRDQCECS